MLKLEMSNERLFGFRYFSFISFKKMKVLFLIEIFFLKNVVFRFEIIVKNQSFILKVKIAHP